MKSINDFKILKDKISSQRSFSKQLKGEDVGFEFRKIPASIDVEEAIVGAILLESNAIDKVIDILNADDFYSNKHQLIFKAAKKLLLDNKPIDLKTVQSQLSKNEDLESVGGISYIAKLTNKVVSSANIEAHAHLIKELSLKRKLISYSSEINELSYDESTDIIDLLERAESKLTDICSLKEVDEPTPSEFIFKEAAELMELEANPDKFNDKFKGITSGFWALDLLTKGWKKGNVIVVAARPAMGKTAFATTIFSNALNESKNVAFFSLEMSKKEIFNRLLSLRAGVSLNKLDEIKSLSREDWKGLHSQVSILSKSGLHVRDTSVQSLFDVKIKSTRIKRKYGLDLVVIDYLQLMSCKDRFLNREQEISYISRSLKTLAKELDVPIIVLSQLNRAVETRSDKRPALSDLRESGSIEQDADIVLLLHRPEYYGIHENESGNSTRGLAEIFVAKNRNGKTGKVNLRFVPEKTKFEDWSEY